MLNIDAPRLARRTGASVGKYHLLIKKRVKSQRFFNWRVILPTSRAASL
jgi:hypothetical protein